MASFLSNAGPEAFPPAPQIARVGLFSELTRKGQDMAPSCLA
jgi:hypothetical protein